MLHGKNLKIPAKVIRKVVNRHFPFRGQTTFVMTKGEFENRWSAVVADFSFEGYSGCEIMLEPSRERLEEMWIRDHEVPKTEHRKRKNDSIGEIIAEEPDDSIPEYMRLRPEEKKFRWKGEK